MLQCFYCRDLICCFASSLASSQLTVQYAAAAVVGGVGNVWKLNQVFPISTSSTASEDEKKRGVALLPEWLSSTALLTSMIGALLTRIIGALLTSIIGALACF